MTRDGRLWPWGIGLVLGVTMAGNLWVMRLAGSDASFAVEPEYYQRALDWDSTLAQEGRNAALGWRLAATLQPGAGGAEARLVVTLTGANGQAVPGATITVEATHNARAGDVVRAALAPTPDGHYAATLPAGRRGLWQLRFEVIRGAEHFTALLRADTTRDPAGP